MTVSIIKAVGGVVGFLAVLAIHQWLAPSVVTDVARLATAPTPDVTEPASPPLEESLGSDLSSSEQIKPNAESTIQTTASHLLTEGQVESVTAEQVTASAIDLAESERPTEILSLDVVDSDEPVQSHMETIDQLPLSELSPASEVSLSAAVTESEPEASESSLQSIVPSDNSEVPVLQWSAVWRPFFSRTTAQGFADYISESTGLMLRVQPSPVVGHFLVEVQHRTEAERIDADRRIVETTGYQPPGAIK